MNAAMKGPTSSSDPGPPRAISMMAERLGIESWGQGTGYRVQGSGYRVQGSGSRVQGTKYWVPDQGESFSLDPGYWTLPPAPALSFAHLVSCVDELCCVVEGRLLQNAVAQVHDMAVPACCPVEDLTGALPDELF